MENTQPTFNFKKVTSLALACAITLTMLCSCSNVDEQPDPSVTDLPVTSASEATTTTPTTTEIITTTEPLPDPLPEYEEYYEQNSDFIGWLCIPNLTNSKGVPYIDYPILQTTDNSFYLDKDFDKNYSAAGWIYADCKIPITQTTQADNITLYGHSMKDGSFFRHLLDYKSSSSGLSLINDAYIINFDTRWEQSEYIIVSCFLIGIYEWQDDEPLFEYFKCRTFDTEEDFNYFYENIMYRSYYLSDIECEYGDEFLTLSTCAYDFSDSRFVVVARKVREGEDTSVYSGTYTKNRSKHMPSILD